MLKSLNDFYLRNVFVGVQLPPHYNAIAGDLQTICIENRLEK